MFASALPCVCQGAENDWRVSLSGTYASGDYGTDDDSETTYVPLTVRRLFEKGDLALVIPYVRVSSEGTVTLVDGVPNRIRKGRGKGKETGEPSPEPSVQTASSKETESGLGDILLKGRYYLLEESDLLPLVAVVGRIKFPTADEDKGLGTGEFDEGLGLEVSKYLSQNWVGFVDLGYAFIGSPSDLNLENQWYYDLGIGYYLSKDLFASAYYEEYSALVDGTPNARDLFFQLNYAASPVMSFDLGLEIGLSDGAPDYGLTGGINVYF